MKTTPETLYLAQLLDQRASEVRRTAVPIEAMTGEWRDVYRAIVAVSHGSDVVAVEAVIDEKTVRDLIPALKALGAEGIIEYPLNKVVY